MVVGLGVGLAAGVGIGLLIGGGENESVNTHESNTESITDMLSSISNKLENKVKTDVTALQKISLEEGDAIVDGPGSKCETIINQDMKVGVHSALTAVTELSTTQMAELAEKIATNQTTAIEQVNEKLNLGQSNLSEVNSRINNHLQANMANIVENSIENSNITTVSTSQNIVYKAGDCIATGGGEVLREFNQNMVLDVVAEQISDQAITSLQSLEVYRDVTNEQSAEIRQRNTGIEPIMSSSSSCGSCIISLVILFALGLLPKLIPNFSSSGSQKVEDYGPMEDYGMNEPMPQKAVKEVDMDMDMELDIELEKEMHGGSISQIRKRRKSQMKKKVTGGGESGGMSIWRIGLTILSIVLGCIFIYMVYEYHRTKPDNEILCPTEKQCSDNWDKVMKEKTWGAKKKIINENCRMEHHFYLSDVTDENGEIIHKKGEPINGKPEYFGPRCEQPCAYKNRMEAEGKKVNDNISARCS